MLQLSEYIEHVQDDGAGAISTFSGVTRNVFDGTKVLQLEYEAYEGMAERVLKVRSMPASFCSECSKLRYLCLQDGRVHIIKKVNNLSIHPV